MLQAWEDLNILKSETLKTAFVWSVFFLLNIISRLKTKSPKTAITSQIPRDPRHPKPVHSPILTLKPEAKAAVRFIDTAKIPVIKPICFGKLFLIYPGVTTFPMQIPKPMNIDPKNSIHREPVILRNNPKLKIINEYIKNRLILNLCENRLTKTEQVANINSGIEVSILTWKLSKPKACRTSLNTGATEIIGDRKLLDTKITINTLIINKI